MNHEKAVQFANTILKRTEEGSISWEITDNETRFEASYPDQTLAIFEESGFDKDIGEEYTTHILELINSSGRRVTQVQPSEIHSYIEGSAFAMFRRIYSLARDKALKIDDELAKLYRNFEQEDEISW